MTQFKECTPGEALDALLAGKRVQYLYHKARMETEGEWTDVWYETQDVESLFAYRVNRLRIVTETPAPQLPKYAGWMFVASGKLVYDQDWDSYVLDDFAKRGEIVSPSVWMKDR